MDKIEILETIKKVTSENGGTCPTMQNFIKLTGIKEGLWLGKYWARWSDAVKEAGFTTRGCIVYYDKPYLMKRIIELIREIKKIPTGSEIELKKYNDKTFPGYNAFLNHFGSKQLLMKEILRFCSSQNGFQDVGSISIKEYRRLYPREEAYEAASEDDFSFASLLNKGTSYQLLFTDVYLSADILERRINGIKCLKQYKTLEPKKAEEIWKAKLASKHEGDNWYILTEQDLKILNDKKMKTLLKPYH